MFAPGVPVLAEPVVEIKRKSDGLLEPEEY